VGHCSAHGKKEPNQHLQSQPENSQYANFKTFPGVIAPKSIKQSKPYAC
jgi:hypothetical protein